MPETTNSTERSGYDIFAPDNRDIQVPLRRSELKDAEASLAENNGILPETVARILAIKPDNEGINRILDLPKLFAFLWIVSNFCVGAFPEIAQLLDFNLPERVGNGLNRFNPDLSGKVGVEHMANILFYLMIASGAAAGINFGMMRHRGRIISALQNQIKPKIAAGELTIEMEEGHSALFAGRSDKCANRLQEGLKPGMAMVYAEVRSGDGQMWIRKDKNKNPDEVSKEFDLGDFDKAGKVIIFPVKEEDTILPGDDGHDMNFAQIRALVTSIDRYCKQNRINSKRIYIVGSSLISETYATRNMTTGKTTKNRDTLAGLIGKLNRGRDENAKIEIVDPTKLVMTKILEITGKKKLRFHCTEESMRRYGKRFQERLALAGHRQNHTGQRTRRKHQNQTMSPKEETITIHYNITDIDSLNLEGEDMSNHVVVLLDPGMKATAIAQGVPEQNILIVPEIVNDELTRLALKKKLPVASAA